MKWITIKNAIALIVDIYDTYKNGITKRNTVLNLFVSKFSALVYLVFLTLTLNKMPIYIKIKYPPPGLDSSRLSRSYKLGMSDKLTQTRGA